MRGNPGGDKPRPYTDRAGAEARPYSADSTRDYVAEGLAPS